DERSRTGPSSSVWMCCGTWRRRGTRMAQANIEPEQSLEPPGVREELGPDPSGPADDLDLGLDELPDPVRAVRAAVTAGLCPAERCRGMTHRRDGIVDRDHARDDSRRHG